MAVWGFTRKRTLQFLPFGLMGFLAVLPFFVDVDASFFAYYLFLSFCFVTLGQGWNIVGGYAGQISLASHAFFALGAYTTALIWTLDPANKFFYFNPLLILAGGLSAAVFAFLVGTPLLYRLKGDFFAFGSFAASEVLRTIILRWMGFTGGAHGLSLPADFFTTLRPHYWAMLLLACLSTGYVLFMERSRMGLILKAISEDEVAAATRGINVLLYKVLAFVVGGFFIGMCGSVFTYYLLMINPQSVMNLNWMFLPILVSILGGKGTAWGPVIGAFVIGGVYGYLELIGGIHPMISGALIIVLMKYMPQGLVGLMAHMARVKGA